MSICEGSTISTIVKDSIGFGISIPLPTDKSLTSKLSSLAEEEGCIISADARIDYRSELGKSLSFSSEQAVKMPDSQIILKAYLKWGKGCLKYIFGDFAFAIWDNRIGELFVARDHIGCKPLVYHTSTEEFVFGTSIKSLFSMKSIPKIIDDKWICDILMNIYPEKNRTPYESIQRLEPAHYLVVSKTETKKTKYWKLKINDEFPKLPIEETAEVFRKMLFKSVSNRMLSNESVGSELSGGLDSSSVTMIASMQSQKEDCRFSAFSHVMSEEMMKTSAPFNDESHYSNLVAQLAEVKNHYRISGENRGVLSIIESNISLLAGIGSVDYSLFSEVLYECAFKNEVSVLLSGFGGDEGVSNQAYGFLDELKEKSEWRSYKYELKCHCQLRNKRFTYALIKAYLSRFMPEFIHNQRRNRYQYKWLKVRYNTFALDPKFEAEMNAFDRYVKIKSNYYSKDVRDSQASRLEANIVSLRLEQSYLVAQKYGIDYRYPLLDVKLLEFYYNIPSNMKYQDGYGRFLFRKTIERILPKKIAWRHDKTGATIPNIRYRVKVDENGIRDLILESRKMNNIHYVNYDKVIWMLDQILLMKTGKNSGFVLAPFFGYIKLLIIQKWQREGKIDIGIKC